MPADVMRRPVAASEACRRKTLGPKKLYQISLTMSTFKSSLLAVEVAEEQENVAPEVVDKKPLVLWRSEVDGVPDVKVDPVLSK